MYSETAVDRPYRVLYLCTGNSARSILAEVLTNRFSYGKFEAYSAGSRPCGFVDPFVLDLLRDLKLPAEGLRSKSWDEFAQPGAPEMDFIVTVCDRAAGEACPVWPGHPLTAHWGVPDPAAATGSDESRRETYRRVMYTLQHRITLLTELNVTSLDRLALRTRLGEIATQVPLDDAS